MSTKDFKQGMVAGAKPFGDKLDQLANVSEKAVSDIQEGIDGVNEVVNVVLDDLSAQEKKRIYDLDEATDISNLEDDEKEFLVAVLTELANSVPMVTDLQRKYIISVCSTVGIAAPQVSLNLACIENIENMRTQKILLRHVMEFFYIGCQDYEFLDEYDDLIFCYFSVNKRGVNEIITTIDRIYNAMGIEGLANRYTFVAGYEELVEEDASEEEINSEDSISEKIIDPSLYEKIELSGIISVQDPTEYCQKNIRLDAVFSVNSDLLFKNCTISITSAASFNVTGTITFQNCEITCETEREKENYIISTLDDAKLILNNCVLHQVKWFAHAHGDVEIDKCTFVHSSEIIYATSASENSFNISNSFICINNLVDCGFIVRGYSKFASNNIQTSWSEQPTKDKRYGLFEIHASNGTISNCILENIEIEYSSDVCVENSTIKNAKCSVKSLSHCQIENSEIDVDDLIDTCDFSNMTEVTVTANNISNSIFSNINNETDDFITINSSVSNCIFSNVNMVDGVYLIFACVSSGIGDKRGDVRISNCRFMNCYTDRYDKKLISGQETKYGLFSDKRLPYEPICSNCMGLNDVKSGKFVEQKVQDTGKISTGAKIGAGIGAVIAGPLGAIGGAMIAGSFGKIRGALLEKQIADNSDSKGNDFKLTVEDVFNIRAEDGNLYPVVTGIIEFGHICVNDTVSVTNSEGASFETVVSGIAREASLVDEASEGDDISLMFKKCTKSDFSEGDIITK